MESEAAQWRQIYRRLKSEGKPCAPRGLKILEVENFSYSLAPYVRFSNFEARHLNLEYIREEFQWYLVGDPYDLGILQHASIWRNLVLRGRLNSNYGLYVFRKGGLDWAATELARDKDSRRACITILDHTHLKEETLDVPCTAYMNFRIRCDKLNMSVHMRSQDAIYGMTNDAPAFSFVHEMLYVTLRDTCYPDLQMGDYHHTADSFHVYARHFKMLDELCKDGAEFTTIEAPLIRSAQEVDYIRSCSWMTDVPPHEFDFTHWLTNGKPSVRSGMSLRLQQRDEGDGNNQRNAKGDSGMTYDDITQRHDAEVRAGQKTETYTFGKNEYIRDGVTPSPPPTSPRELIRTLWAEYNVPASYQDWKDMAPRSGSGSVSGFRREWRGLNVQIILTDAGKWRCVIWKGDEVFAETQKTFSSLVHAVSAAFFKWLVATETVSEADAEAWWTEERVPVMKAHRETMATEQREES